MLPADGTITISPKAGELPPGASQRLRVAFQPQFPSSIQSLQSNNTSNDDILRRVKELQSSLLSKQIPCYSVVKRDVTSVDDVPVVRLRDTVYLSVEAPAVPPALMVLSGVESKSIRNSQSILPSFIRHIRNQ